MQIDVDFKHANVDLVETDFYSEDNAQITVSVHTQTSLSKIDDPEILFQDTYISEISFNLDLQGTSVQVTIIDWTFKNMYEVGPAINHINW